MTSVRRSRWLLLWLAGAPFILMQYASARERFADCEECPRMVVIPAGAFTMGSPESERERMQYEGPRAGVTIASFAISETEITRKQYARFVEDTRRSTSGGCFTYGFSSFTDPEAIDPNASWRNVGFAQGDDHPVVCVSWRDAQDYAAWLTRRTGQTYRLPSEAEWEYAARAGSTSTFVWGDDERRGCEWMNGGDEALLRTLPGWREALRQDGDAAARSAPCDDQNAFTSPVRSYRPNALGLYDVIGNAWEWVQDCWSASLPASEAPHFEESCTHHRTRGGSWDDYPRELRSARRGRLYANARRNDVGFRIARTTPR